ncbi:MAG: 3'-5' exonuclease DinG [Chlamydiales bacterium]|nr:3'-5' exonuclease DinG [Chlamydiales bacterium]
MTLLNKARFVCLDCEFTGLDLDKDRIIEVAAVRFTFTEMLDEYDQLVKPDCPISEEALAIHHISAQMVADKPSIDTLLPEFLSFIGKDLIVGHAVGSDIEMLSRAAERAHIPCHLKTRPFIDTLRLARLYGDSPNNSLGQLATHFNIAADPAHRALNDVKMNIEVFKHLVQRFKTVEQIQEILSKPIKMKYMPLGKHKGRLFSEIPLQYLLWASHADFDQDLLYTIRLEIKKRKKGTGFRDAVNPFSDL